jgi:3-hydroxyacyl-CoA dehydrogenase
VGIFKRDRDAQGQSTILAYRPASKTYETLAPEVFPWSAEAAGEKDTVKRIQFILSHRDRGALFVWRNMRDIFSYAAYLLTSIADGYVKPVDDAVRWGFNWEMGPFELWQALGYDTILARLREDGVPLPAWLKPGLKFYDLMPGSHASRAAGGPRAQLKAETATGSMKVLERRKHEYTLPVFENTEDPRVVFSHPDASLVDIGDGVACFVMHGKMNTINSQVTALLRRSLDAVTAGFQGLVIGNDAPYFSAGADLRDFVRVIESKKWNSIHEMEVDFQSTMLLLKYAPFPVVSCPRGLTLGGACELSLHTYRQVLAAETNAGLVEANVGLLPAGGGTKELALRSYLAAAQAPGADPLPFLSKAFDLIRKARLSASGFEAIEWGLYASASSEVVLSKEHVVHRAKQSVLFFAENFRPRVVQNPVAVLGKAGIEHFTQLLAEEVAAKTISTHDQTMARRVATVLCGGEVPAGTWVSEQGFLDLERHLIVELCQEPKSLERLKHMLVKGQALKN